MPDAILPFPALEATHKPEPARERRSEEAGAFEAELAAREERPAPEAPARAEKTPQTDAADRPTEEAQSAKEGETRPSKNTDAGTAEQTPAADSKEAKESGPAEPATAAAALPLTAEGAGRAQPEKAKGAEPTLPARQAGTKEPDGEKPVAASVAQPSAVNGPQGATTSAETPQATNGHALSIEAPDPEQAVQPDNHPAAAELAAAQLPQSGGEETALLAPVASALPGNTPRTPGETARGQNAAGPTTIPGAHQAAKGAASSAQPLQGAGGSPTIPDSTGALPSAGAEDALAGAGADMAKPASSSPPPLTPGAAPLSEAQAAAALPKDIAAAHAEAIGGTRNAGASSLPLRAEAQAPARTPQDIAVRIARGAQSGQSRFEIRLDPPELGRIDIRLEMNADGRMQAVLQADKPETLDMLQRDARALERALAEQGMDMSGGGLNFALRQDSSGRDGGAGYGSASNSGNGAEDDAPDADFSALEAGGLLVERRLGVDMRI